MRGVDDFAVRERIQKLIHLEGLSQREFAEKLNRNPSNLSQSLTGGRGVPRGLIEDIIDAYPDIRKEWLLYGDGLMFKELVEVDEMVKEVTRPRLPIKTEGIHIDEFINGTKCYKCDHFPIIKQFPDYDFTLILNNDTMSPRYERNDEIALIRSSFETIEWGTPYVLDTKEGLKFKIVYDNGEFFRLASYDAVKYPEFNFPKKDVVAVYKYVGMIRV